MKTCFKVCALLVASALSSGLVHAESKPVNAAELQGLDGINRARALMDAVRSGDFSQLPEETRKALQSGVQSGNKAADTSNMDAKTVDFSVKQAEKWEAMAREAYVAALPPRDRALGASVLLGDGAHPNNMGQMYIFVSRSMPQSLLRAYAVDAFYLGASLVVKGIRKGDTLKEYLAEAMEAYNSVDGMTMAGMEINPNLFDMFDVRVVPAVVWTNRVGLNDVGSGCQNPEGASAEKLNLTGPDDELIQVDKPVCAKLPESTYFKLTGALAMPYVLDRFEDAGLSKMVANEMRNRLAERTGNVHDGSVRQEAGNAMAKLPAEVKLDRLPKHVLQGLKEQLATGNVQRGPFGPTFSADGEDDAQLRQELNEKIRHGLGL